MVKKYIDADMAISALDRAVCDYCICPCDKPYSKECYAVDNYSAGIRVIEALPSAGVVKVVRCKDCVFWKNRHLCRVFSIHGTVDTNAEDFCSYGERRTDECKRNA